MSSKHTPVHAARHEASRKRAEIALEDFQPRTVTTRCGTPTFSVSVDRTHDALVALKASGYDTVSFVTAVDRFSVAEGRSKGPRYLLVHQLQAIETAEVVRLHTPLSGADPVAPTSTDLWPGANYMEREVWDMFGIRFEGHPYLERLLMPDGYDHHPLRKDFPHQGIEPDRLYREWDEKRRANDIAISPEEQTPSPFSKS